MKLPGALRAVIDPHKLEDYSLSNEHPRGKHKARVFLATLGVSAEDAAELDRVIKWAVTKEECIRGESDRFGERYIVDFLWTRRDRSATVRTTWIVRAGEDFPRLTSCYVR
jgi:hypothetical protein